MIMQARIRLSLYFTIFLFFSFSVQASDSDSSIEPDASVATTEGLPSSLVQGCVCVITGEFVDHEVDAHLIGPEPLVVARSYSSGINKGNIARGWSLNYSDFITLRSDYREHDETHYSSVIMQPSGAFLHYTCPKSDKKPHKLLFKFRPPKGLTNGGSGEVSGRTNLRNQTVTFFPEENCFEVCSGSGNKRTYHKAHSNSKAANDLYIQETDLTASGHCIAYLSGKMHDLAGALEGIHVLNPVTKRLYSCAHWYKSTKPNQHLTLKTSSGKEINYTFAWHTYETKVQGSWGEIRGPVSRCYLAKVERPDRPSVSYQYEPKEASKIQHMVSKRYPKDRFLNIEYYKKGKNALLLLDTVEVKNKQDYRTDRVKTLLAPVGQDQKPIVTHQFIYHAKTEETAHGTNVLDGYTDVYDAYRHKVSYFYDKHHHLSKIEKYTGVGSYKLYSIEKYVWGGEGTPEEGCLIGKYLQEPSGRIYSARYFFYDERGNILCDSLCGRLTGRACPEIIIGPKHVPIPNNYEAYSKAYTYSNDGLNLVLSESYPNGKIIRYAYQPGTNRLISKLTFYEERTQIREFFFYDENGSLIKKIVDDGSVDDEFANNPNKLKDVTKRLVTYLFPRTSEPVGLPERVDEMYLDMTSGLEVLIKRTFSAYSLEGRLLRQDHYDSHGVYCYTLTWDYDAHGNVIREQNALKHEIVRKYDENDNLIFEQGPDLNLYKRYEYDFANRLIKQEVYADGQCETNSYGYDYLGRRIAMTDSHGQSTRYEYDDFGRLIRITHPEVPDENGKLVQPVEEYQYDVAGRVIYSKDKRGLVTLTDYNIRGQPTHIIYPDGTQERFFYSLDGKLHQKIEKNGTMVQYKHDPQGRVTKEEIFSPDLKSIKFKEFNYNAFHLLSTVDSDGLATIYQYDDACRLMRTTQVDQYAEKTKVEQSYDSLGRICEIREYSGNLPDQVRIHHKGYDFLDRVIQERIENLDHVLFYAIRYEYDRLGNKTLVQQGEAITRTDYDAKGRPVKVQDAMGSVTQIDYKDYFYNSYGQYVLQVITTDPLGRKTIETYDVAGHITDVACRNLLDKVIAHTQIFYDLNGNKACTVEDVMLNEAIQRRIYTRWTYNASNQVEVVIEAALAPEQKITRYMYNTLGQKIVQLKPDGIKLLFSYDVQGRLRTFVASDHSFSYVYDYNQKDLPIRIKDTKHQQVTERVYDSLGRLAAEKLGNGLAISYGYDYLGRIIAIGLPDQSSVEYVYDAVDLKEIHRIQNGKRTYSHANLAHNLCGQVVKAQMANQQQAEYGYDLLNRCVSLSTPVLNEQVPKAGYDAAGNLLSYQQNTTTYTFAYDALDQLVTEKGHADHHYYCDSVSNRVVKDGEKCVTNALNQVLSQGKELFVYDANGNLAQKIQNGKAVKYAYDALDRLISVVNEEGTTEYIYDAFNRRLSKRQNGKEIKFLYQGQDEIGAFENGQFTQLKIIGAQRMHQAIAIELHQQAYVPIHDLFGHVSCLTDLQGQVIERYRYSAFGEEEILDPNGEQRAASIVNNPWRFSGKRVDEETGFVAFGLRYYYPSTGKWITPDPIGYGDGPNLYAYLHHSPLMYFDLYGTTAETFSVPYFETPGWFIGCCAKGFNFSTPSKDLPSICQFSENYNLKEILGENANLKEHPKFAIFMTTGIGNTFNDYIKNSMHISNLSEGYNVQGTHAATRGFCGDGARYIITTFFYGAFEPVKKIHQKLDEMFDNFGDDAIYVAMPHSWGCGNFRNALISYPEERRKKINVIALAPGAYIDPDLCKSVVHLASENDIVPYIDFIGRRKCQETIITLKRHPDAPAFDHGIDSPTLAPKIAFFLRRCMQTGTVYSKHDAIGY